MVHRLVLCAAWIWAAFTAAPAHALPQPPQAEPIRAVAPLEWADRNLGKAYQLWPELIELLSHRSGVAMRADFASRSEVLQRTADGALDVVALSSLKRDAGLYRATVPFMQVDQRLYTSPWRGLLHWGQSLDRMTIGVLSNSPVPAWVRTEHPGAQIIEVNSLAEGLLELSRGRIDGFLASSWLVRSTAAALGIDDVVESRVEFTFGLGLAVNRRQPAEVFHALDTGLIEISRNGELDQLLQRHTPAALPTLTEYWAPRVTLLLLLLIMLGVGTSMVVIHRMRRRAARQDAMEGALLRDAPWMVAEVDMRSGTVLRVNRAFAREMGVQQRSLQGVSAADLKLWNVVDDGPAIEQSLRTDGSAMHRRVMLTSPAGQRLLFEGHFAMLNIRGQQVLLVHGTNATEHETLAREHRALIEDAPWIVALTEGRRILLTNAAADRLFGYAPGQIESMDAPKLWPSAHAHAAFTEAVRHAFAENRLFEGEVTMRSADDSPLHLHMTGKLIDRDLRQHVRAIWLVRDIRSEAATREALEAARAAADQASTAKSAFVARMSHEIRTPLHAMINLHEMLRGTRLTKTQQELLQLKSIAQTALMSLVNDVLDFSKIEAGKLELEAVDFEAAALIEELHSVLRSQVMGRRVTLSVSEAGTRDRILRGDAGRLRQVMMNLGSNAIKFTEDGDVRVRVQCDADPDRPDHWRLFFSVSDTGVGMDAETLSALFTPFRQQSAGTPRRYGGTGLGLAISAEIVRAMGSDILVQSKPGQGSTFSFALSLPRGELNGLPPLPEFNPRATAEGRGAQLAGLRILVADDNELNRFVMRNMLGELGAQVFEVADGAAALAWLEHNEHDPPQFVLMDVQMPVMDGISATRLLRANPRWADVQVLAVTGDVTMEQRDAILQAGAVNFVAKPVTSAKLAALLLSTTPQGQAARRTRAPAPPRAAEPAPPPPTLPLPDAALLEVALRELRRGEREWAAIDRRNAAAVHLLAHRLKGTAGELGLRFLWDAAAALEKACKAQPLDAPLWPCDAFASALAEAAAWVTQHLAEADAQEPLNK